MMQFKPKYGLMLVLLAAGVTFAQEPEQPAKQPIPKGNAYLAGGQVGSGTVQLAVFDALVGEAPVARDSLGRICSIVKFDFTFAERGLFEDSTGRLTIMTDYYATQSEDGKLPEFWVKELRERAKVGDTLYFEDILATYPDSVNAKHFYTHPLKLVLVE